MNNLIKKVKLFNMCYNKAVSKEENLEETINDFLKENADRIEVEDIKFSSSIACSPQGAKFIVESVMIIYQESNAHEK